MIILQTTDFEEGFYKIPSDQFTQGEIQEAIDTYEQSSLACLLGVDLANTFVANLLNGEPQDQIYKDIYDAFVREINDCKIVSQGIKNYLKGIIYWQVMRDKNYTSTESGNVVMANENSELLDFENNERISERRFNVSKFTADAIQFYICDNLDIYPEYNGETVKIKYSILL